MSNCGTKRMNKGGALKMVEKGGKKVPFYAADGKGKMKSGGMTGYHKMPDGSMMKNSDHKGMKSGGSVRGAGMARQGVRPCQMR